MSVTQHSMLRAVVLVALLCALTAHAQQSADKRGRQTHTYYIAADEVVWDYAPSGMNKITGGAFEEVQKLWVERGLDRLGRRYKKTIFREYTDDAFTKLKLRPSEWEHLGILGPLLRAEVGDTIKVIFKNNGKHAFSLHPHGVFYNKDSEGSTYDDGSGGLSKKGTVPPGGTHTYVWLVPERAGPAPGEPSSMIWMYHSHVDEEKDLNAGLVGPLIISTPGTTKPDGTPKDVDRELVTAFVEVDENLSWHFDENIQTYAKKPEKIKKTDNFADPFYISNLKESINGFIYGHTPPLTMRKGERVRWYLFATTNFELHAPHWHGNTVMAKHMRTDVTPLMPMDMLVADMVPDNPGTWLFHCHTGPHLRAGMITKYVVQDTAAAHVPSPR